MVVLELLFREAIFRHHIVYHHKFVSPHAITNQRLRLLKITK